MKWVPLTKENIRVGDVVRTVPSMFEDSTACARGLDILHVGVVYAIEPVGRVSANIHIKMEDQIWWTSCLAFYLTLRGN